MESDHGMATGQDGVRDETLLGLDHVQRRLLSTNMSLGGTPPKRNDKRPLGDIRHRDVLF
jgi:hypothetical protein